MEFEVIKPKAGMHYADLCFCLSLYRFVLHLSLDISVSGYLLCPAPLLADHLFLLTQLLSFP